MPFARKGQRHQSPHAVSLFLTSQSMTRLTALRAPTNLIWCRAQWPPVLRVKLLPVLRHMRRSSIYSRLADPASTRFTPRFSPAFLMGHRRRPALRGGNSSRTKFSQRGPTMVTMQSSHRPVEAVQACGCQLLAFLPYLLPQWGFVVPFGMSSSSQFRPPGPPSLDSQQYAADYEEVKELGALVGSTRTEEQTEIALFWADGAGTETPPGHWNSIAQIIGAAQGNTLEENARLFALLNIAMADAAICSWDAKYTFHFWRPVTAIAFAEPELNWMSFIVTPPFPDYTSGHSTFIAAAATVLPLFYGTEDLPFTVGSDFLPDVYRSFPTCFDAAEEAAVSRIYGGIHFRSASEDGLQAGTSIGEWTVTHYLLPSYNRGR